MKQAENHVEDIIGFLPSPYSPFHLNPIVPCLQISGFVLIFGAGMDLRIETISVPKVNLDWSMPVRVVCHYPVIGRGMDTGSNYGPCTTRIYGECRQKTFSAREKRSAVTISFLCWNSALEPAISLVGPSENMECEDSVPLFNCLSLHLSWCGLLLFVCLF